MIANLLTHSTHWVKVLQAATNGGANEENQFVTNNGVLQDLVPNTWVFVAHVLAAIVVLSIVVFLIWRPTKNMLQARRELMDQKMYDADNNKRLAEKYLKEIVAEKLTTQQLANKIISDSQREADLISNEAQTKARDDAKNIYEKALSEAEKIKLNAQEGIKKNVTDLAFDIASKILSENTNSAANQRIVDEYLTNLK